jgi:hypothetical protein
MVSVAKACTKVSASAVERTLDDSNHRTFRGLSPIRLGLAMLEQATVIAKSIAQTHRSSRPRGIDASRRQTSQQHHSTRRNHKRGITRRSRQAAMKTVRTMEAGRLFVHVHNPDGKAPK